NVTLGSRSCRGRFTELTTAMKSDRPAYSAGPGKARVEAGQEGKITPLGLGGNGILVAPASKTRMAQRRISRAPARRFHKGRSQLQKLSPMVVAASKTPALESWSDRPEGRP